MRWHVFYWIGYHKVTLPLKTLQQIVHKVGAEWQLLDSHPLRGGMSANVTLLTVFDGDNQQRWILRYHDQHNHLVQREYDIQMRLSKSDIPVAKPLLLDTSSDIIAPAYIVLAYVEGEAIYATPPTDEFLQQYVDTLVAIHRVQLIEADKNSLPNLTEAYESIIAHQADKLDTSLNEGQIRYGLRTGWLWQVMNSPVLLHGDYWLGNLIWREEQLQAVVDWEDVAIGDPLIDLAYSRLEMLFAFGQEVMHTITDRYQQQMPHLDYISLPYWDLCSALRPMHRIDEWGAGWADFGRPDVTGQTMREVHQWYVGQAFKQLGG